MKEKINIAILGAGPSAMISALALASYGIKSTLFEKQELNASFFCDVRNFALTEKSLNFFKRLSIFEHINDRLVRLSNVYVADNRNSQILELDSQDSKTNNLGYMIKASDLKTTLYSLVEKNKLIQVYTKKIVQDIKFNNDNNSTLIINDKDEFSADLVLVCDGKNSLLKKKLFKDSINHDYHQKALVFDISHSKSHEMSALEHFLPGGVTALLPLLDENKSSIVLVENSQSAEILARISKEELLAHLYHRIGYAYGDIKIETDISLYPIHASLSEKYFFKNVVLVGDSAHAIHPLAGQGMNQAIKDIIELTDLINENLSIGIEIDDILLKKYETARKFDNSKMFKITHYLNMIFCNNLPILSFSRKLGLSLINRIDILKKIILQSAMGL